MPALRHLVAALLPFTVLAAQTPLQLQWVANVNRPVAVTAPPGDLQRVFVVEQQGRIRIVKNGVLLPTPFLDLTGLGVISFGGELGLLGLAFHPDYATNGQFFVFHSGFPWPTSYVKRFTVSAGNPDVANVASSTVIWSTPTIYGNHNGGTLAFGPDRKLYITHGDGGSTAPLWPDDPTNTAQRGDTFLGKILRIDVDAPQPPLLYGIPPDNPFVGPGDPRDEIWALGLRNPWRCSFDRLTGDLWIADVGGFREEIDFQPAGVPGGRNYGWSCTTGSQCNPPLVCTCNGPLLTPPIHDYGNNANPHCIIGGSVYRGVAIPDLRGAYFFADFMSQQIWSCRRNGSGITQLVDRTSELTPSVGVVVGPTSFGEDGYGELYLCDLSGGVFKIVPASPALVGVVPYGVGTPGCSGAHTLTAVNSPVLGNPAFGLRAANGPANGLGVMAIADQADVAGTSLPGFGFVAHLQVTAPLLVLSTMVAGGSGVGSYAFAVPPAGSLVGVNLFAQAIWPWPTSICAPTVSGWSSSPGLAITLQP